MDGEVAIMAERLQGPAVPSRSARRHIGRRWLGIMVALLTVAGGTALYLQHDRGQAPAQAAPPPPLVTVSPPLRQMVTPYTQFLGQFSAVAAVEVRAQVGGVLTEIHFTDGQIVHKGDLLFVIDPRPYEIKLAQAAAQVQSSQAKLELAKQQLARAQVLRKDNFGPIETVDQRQADVRAAQAELDQAMAAVRDAQLDLEYCHVTAPFTGRISSHRVSVGNLVSGSRGGTTPTTLLTTLVALDPVYLDFDMSESDYLTYRRTHPQNGHVSDNVTIAVGDETQYSRIGKLDFIDNTLDRASGTIHARATVPNPDLALTPGVFARLRVAMGPAHPALLVPDAAVSLDQSNRVVMTVDDRGNVIPRQVQIGVQQGGLREITEGVGPDDKVVIDGLMRAQPGAKISTQPGTIHGIGDSQG